MPPHSFLRHLRDSAVFLSFFASPLAWWITGECADNFGFADVLRFELNNIWSSNDSGCTERDVSMGRKSRIVNQGPANNADPIPSPLLTVLSTYYNQTYISTSASGLQDAPCPDGYKYNSNSSGSDNTN
ncbi:hypothetical protein BDZ45DRAFT_362687 [Acephala macrosclerotiorum]|nr:hypothetical protein BDZ45DRAFT_362687 [Acephala macrosclerotiorum]